MALQEKYVDAHFDYMNGHCYHAFKVTIYPTKAIIEIASSDDAEFSEEGMSCMIQARTTGVSKHGMLAFANAFSDIIAPEVSIVTARILKRIDEDAKGLPGYEWF